MNNPIRHYPVRVHSSQAVNMRSPGLIMVSQEKSNFSCVDFPVMISRAMGLQGAAQIPYFVWSNFIVHTNFLGETAHMFIDTCESTQGKSIHSIYTDKHGMIASCTNSSWSTTARVLSSAFAFFSRLTSHSQRAHRQWRSPFQHDLRPSGGCLSFLTCAT